MSGGGAFRAAAAKVAGITVANSGLRGIALEHPLSSAARNAVRPVSVSGISSASEHVKSGAVSASRSTAVDGASVQRSCWDLDDWVFAGGTEEEMVAAGEPLPRLVFGGAPSLQEAKEATCDLKDALQKVYMSTPPSDCGSSNVVAQVNKDHSLPSNSSSLMTKACVTSENAVTHGAPKHAIRAFRFLYENDAAQTVVASIASDPNVWNAVLANPELQEFLVSQKASASVLDGGEYSVEESVADTDFLHYSSPRSDNLTSDEGSSKPGNGFTDFLQNIKAAVIDMMNCLSDFFQNLSGGYKVFADADGSAKISIMDRTLGASFMGLAIMVIMVIVLKRA